MTKNKKNCVIVPERPQSTPDEVATAMVEPCFCRNRMFMSVDAAPVGSTMLVNETAYCMSTAGPSGTFSSTDPMVVNA